MLLLFVVVVGVFCLLLLLVRCPAEVEEYRAGSERKGCSGKVRRCCCCCVCCCCWPVVVVVVVATIHNSHFRFRNIFRQ